jgi:hypothetical protein
MAIWLKPLRIPVAVGMVAVTVCLVCHIKGRIVCNEDNSVALEQLIVLYRFVVNGRHVILGPLILESAIIVRSGLDDAYSSSL